MASLTAATAGMASLSVSSGADNGGTAANGGEGLVFTAEERAAFAAVEAALLGTDNGRGNGLAPGDVRPREVAVITMVSKGRVEKSVEKYKQFVTTLGEYGLTVSSLYEDRATLHAKLAHKWKVSYQVCGADSGGRSIMWIGSSEPTQVAEEQTVVHCGILYWMAVHSDLRTLREGCTFVIDTSKQDSIGKVGNERKLQKTWQALPLRPQNLFIVGASFLKRLFINALIKFASVFSNSKVLARIQFVEMPEVRKVVSEENMPHELGGEQRSSVEEYVMARLQVWEGFEVGEAKSQDVEISL